MASQSFSAMSPNGVDPREICFTNLLLLGFDPVASEEKHKISFTRDMFSFINKRGMEVVMHFLFSQLNSHLAYEEFRDCWPVYDKKQEQQFRKACVNWLATIAKDDPQSKLPRLSASLLLSPGGDKFYLFLLHFSSYVLKAVCVREAKTEEKQVMLSSFLTSSSTFHSTHKNATVSALKAHVCCHVEHTVQRLQLVTALHEEWRTYSCQLTGDYRTASKRGRERLKRLRSLQETQKLMALEGTPKKGLLSGSEERVLAFSNDRLASKRQTLVKKVRELWKEVENFEVTSAHQREVVDSILQGRANQYRISASDIAFQIPEVLVREYEALVSQGKVGNTYEAGKLNLLSLIQVWKCSLQVLQEQLHHTGLPSFESEVRYMAEKLQAHRGHLATAQTLRASLVELQQSIDEAIHQLETRLKTLRESTGGGKEEGMSELNVEGSFTAPLFHIPAITIPSLGLGLLPPSPKKPNPASVPTVAMSSPAQSTLAHLGLPEDTVPTPVAIQNISKSIQLTSQLAVSHKAPSSRIPSLSTHAATATETTSPHTSHQDGLSIFADSPQGILTRGTLLTETVVHEKTVTRPSVHADHTPVVSSERRKDKEGRYGRTGKAGGKLKRPLTRDSRPEDVVKTRESLATLLASRPREPALSTPKGAHLDSAARHSSHSPASVPSQQTTPLSRPKPDSSVMPKTPLLETMPQAHNLLADQIAAAVVESPSPHTPTSEIHSIVDPISAMGTEAFVSKDKLLRTPISKPVHRAPAFQSQLSPVQQSPSVNGTSPPMAVTTPTTTPGKPPPVPGDSLSFEQLAGSDLIPDTPVHILPFSSTSDHSPIPTPTCVSSGSANGLGNLIPMSDSLSPPSTQSQVFEGDTVVFSQSLEQSVRTVTFHPTPSTPVTVELKVVQSYTTPIQSPGFLMSVAQPPTPFQHAWLDLDSEDEASLGSKGETDTSEPLLLSQEEDNVSSGLPTANENRVNDNQGLPPLIDLSTSGPPIPNIDDAPPTLENISVGLLLDLEETPPQGAPPVSISEEKLSDWRAPCSPSVTTSVVSRAQPRLKSDLVSDAQDELLGYLSDQSNSQVVSGVDENGALSGDLESSESLTHSLSPLDLFTGDIEFGQGGLDFLVAISPNHSINTTASCEDVY